MGLQTLFIALIYLSTFSNALKRVDCGCIISVPYDFGVGRQDCYKERFKAICNHTTRPPKLWLGENIPLLRISVDEGTVDVELGIAFTSHNKLGISEYFDQGVGLGINTVDVTPCSKEECCQTEVHNNLKILDISLTRYHDDENQLQFNPCSYGFVVDPTWLKNSLNINLKVYPHKHTSSQLVQGKCEDPNRIGECTCGPNANCNMSTNGTGHGCSCREGLNGNPYTGCEDIDLKTRKMAKPEVETDTRSPRYKGMKFERPRSKYQGPVGTKNKFQKGPSLIHPTRITRHDFWSTPARGIILSCKGGISKIKRGTFTILKKRSLGKITCFPRYPKGISCHLPYLRTKEKL